MDALQRLRRPGNPLTRRATRRQTWLEIYLPLIAAAALIGVLVAAAALAGYGTAGSWADVVLTVLAVPLALVLVLLLAALVAGSVLLIRLMQEIPGYAGGVRDGVDQVARDVRRGSDLAVRPVIIPGAVVEAMRQALRSARGLLSRDWDGPNGT